MLQYIDVVNSYLEAVRKRLNYTSTLMLVIIDNFKGQITPNCMRFLEYDTTFIHACCPLTQQIPCSH